MDTGESSEYYSNFMHEALKEARLANDKDEVPVGAVIVREGKVIGRGHNLRESDKDPTAHAEMIAIKEASKNLDAWRLMDSEIFVTLEPCPMCMGAILQARIDKLVYGCMDPKAGAAGSLYDLSNDSRLNHSVEVIKGIEEESAKRLLKDFFKKLRD
jgi:tRNA(adenine34) deaminase